ncbi:MAG: SIS domain-containing protein [Actinomycetes bacterium]
MTPSRSWLESEIRSQPEILATRLAGQAANTKLAHHLLRRPDVTHAVIAARGSSDNAARYAQYLFGKTLGLSTYLGAPSLFTQPTPPSLTGAAVLAISQSGQSPDVVSVLAAARKQGRPTIAITNDPHSPVAAVADVVIDLATGPELSLAATKTFTASLQAIIAIAAEAGDQKLSQGLAALPAALDKVIEQGLEELDPGLATAPNHPFDFLTTVGRATGFAAASETALKIREVAGLRAEAYAVPDLLHGPIAANGPGSSAWLIASPSQSPEYWTHIVDRLTAAGVAVTAIVPGPSQLRADLVHQLPAGLDSSPAWLFDFLAVAYGQIAALRLGLAAGRDVDHPQGLAKVTLTS